MILKNKLQEIDKLNKNNEEQKLITQALVEENNKLKKLLKKKEDELSSRNANLQQGLEKIKKKHGLE